MDQALSALPAMSCCLTVPATRQRLSSLSCRHLVEPPVSKRHANVRSRYIDVSLSALKSTAIVGSFAEQPGGTVFAGLRPCDLGIEELNPVTSRWHEYHESNMSDFWALSDERRMWSRRLSEDYEGAVIPNL